MRKKLRVIYFFIFFALLAFSITEGLNKSKTSSAASDDGMYTITVLNGNKKAGEASIGVQQGDKTYKNVGQTVDVLPGTKVKFYFPNGLNEGYDIYCWANHENGKYAITPSAATESGYYENEEFNITVTKDIELLVLAKAESEHIVTYYNVSSSSTRSIIGLEAVEDGGSISAPYTTIPARKGFNFSGWNILYSATETITSTTHHVVEDLNVYCAYKCNAFTVFRDYGSMFMSGLGVTLIIAVITVFLSLFLGLAICLLKLSNLRIVRFIATAYVEVIRSIPSLLLLLLIYARLSNVVGGIDGTIFSTEVLIGILGLFINSSAYTAEVYRSGIQSVDPGQMEAGRALGMSKWQVYRKIIIPQGLKNSLPSLGNELIMIIKETSLVSTFSLTSGELMGQRNIINSQIMQAIPTYLVVAVIYFVVTFTLSRAVLYLEKRLAR